MFGTLGQQRSIEIAVLVLRANNSTEATMCPMDPTSEHFIHAEKLRQLRKQLSETSDELQRKEILNQIREIEEEIEGKPQKN